jgi:hypothetical protein
MKGRRPGSKGTEWLLIKKHDDAVVEGYNIDEYGKSALTGKTLAQVAGDEGADEWKSSRPASRGKVKAPWLAETLAKLDKKKAKAATAAPESKPKKAPAVKKKKLSQK